MKGKTPSALLQIEMTFTSGKKITIVSDHTWDAFNGDAHRKPAKAQHGNSAGTGFIEYIDAREEPVGWMLPSFRVDQKWRPAVATVPSKMDVSNIHAKMEPPIQMSSVTPKSTMSIGKNAFMVDMGRELQGGLRLSVMDGQQGQTVHIACGEAYDAENKAVKSTWGWEFDWTLRQGEQLLEQHKYMECRFVSVAFSGAAPTNWSLSAWKVHDHARRVDR